MGYLPHVSSSYFEAEFGTELRCTLDSCCLVAALLALFALFTLFALFASSALLALFAEKRLVHKAVRFHDVELAILPAIPMTSVSKVVLPPHSVNNWNDRPISSPCSNISFHDLAA